MFVPRFRALRLLLAIAAVLVAAACADARIPPPEGVPEDAPFVSQDRLTFWPDELRVRLGERIYFWNGETAIHNLIFDKAARSPDMEAGGRLRLALHHPPASTSSPATTTRRCACA